MDKEKVYIIIPVHNRKAITLQCLNTLKNNGDLDQYHVVVVDDGSCYENLPMDYADASLVVLAEYLSDGRILTTDRRDFSIYRWHDKFPFENLLFI